jgi:hypothetical protein
MFDRKPKINIDNGKDCRQKYQQGYVTTNKGMEISTRIWNHQQGLDTYDKNFKMNSKAVEILENCILSCFIEKEIKKTN